jgi:hypothetical protein
MPFPIPFKGKRSKSAIKRPIETGVDHFVNGSYVTFKLGELDHTFEKFYVLVNEEGLFLKVPKEVPMNLMNILDTIHDEVGVNRKNVLDSDVVDMILQLDPDLFTAFQARILECTDVLHIFDLDMEGYQFLKELEHYYLIEYGTTTKRLDFHLGGKLGNAIRRNVGF